MFVKKQIDSPKESWGGGVPILSAILLERESFTTDSFLKQMAKTCIRGKTVSDIKPEKEGVFSFQVGDEFFAFLHISAPYPDDLEGPIATSWMWPREPTIENVKQHRSFLQITMTGGAEDPVRRRLTLTAVTALAAKQSGVMAVYWGDASLVIFPPLFVGMAEEINSPQSPPLYLWVDLRAFRNEDGAVHDGAGTARAHGDRDSGYRHGDRRVPRMASRNRVRPAGERSGSGGRANHREVNEQQIRIRHCPSSFGHPGNVIRLQP
jgi:hypothetical protein